MSSIKKELKKLPVVKVPRTLDARIYSMIARATVSERPRSLAVAVNLWIYLVSCAIFLIVGYAIHLYTLSGVFRTNSGDTHVSDRLLSNSGAKFNVSVQVDPFQNEWRDIHTWVGK